MAKLTDSQLLSVQYTLARLASLEAGLARRDLPEELRGYLSLRLQWIEGEVRNIVTGEDGHSCSAGIACDCHDVFRGPETPKADCPACNGSGLIAHAKLVANASADEDEVRS